MQVQQDKVEEYKEDEETKELVEQLSKELSLVNQLSKDTLELVQGQQQQNVDVIEQEASAVNLQVVEAGKELKKAAQVQNKKYKWLFGGGLATLGGVLGLIGGPVGAAIGASVGASVGAGAGRYIEKKDNKEVEKAKFIR